MTTPTPVPAVVLASEFPTGADRVAGIFNAKAAAWANSENAMATRSRAIAQSAYDNAVIANAATGTVLADKNAAAGSASAAASSATAAFNSASTASTKATEASTSATVALNNASGTIATGSAKDWATKTASEVVAGQGFGAKKYATDASASASTATTQAGIATTKAGEASTSASTASTKAGEASTSATTALNNASGTIATGSAKDWATKTASEVVAGQGFGAKKYATDASASASTATTQAGIATTKAGEASTSASTASTKAGEASTSATNANTSAVNASKLNLGPKSSPPTLDNQGATLLQGATYYDTSLNKWRVWTGAAWGDGLSAIAGVATVNGVSGNVTLNTINGNSLLGAGNIIVSTVSLSGDTTMQTNTSVTYTITNYNSFSTYAVSCTAGTVSITGNSISYTPPALAQNVTLTVTVDGGDSLFTLVVTPVPSYIPTPEAAPAFGTAFGGGFYAGKIWNETTQSATSTLIATGTKVFTVADMTATPLFYSGQVVEVRSRANPANKMVGTVSGAGGTSLTVTVTSVGGSGTFTDWSVMARYNIIVAPKSSGDNASIAYKNATTAAPAATGTLTEGRKATLAMVAADNATVYPAAHWANNLNINGKTDWYLPARDELELCWRNLKPTTNNNYTTADRPAAATPNYQNLGSYGGTEATHGLNKNSDPSGAAYTATVPAQTTAAAFKTGGAEAFEFGSSYYWSSTEYNATNAWFQYFSAGDEGSQDRSDKPDARRARAARRQVA